MVAHSPSQPHVGNLFVARSDDVDQQASFLRGWNQSYAQISPGGFFGAVTEIQLDNGRIFSEFTGQTLLQSGVLPSDLFALGIPMDMRGPAIFCGMEDDPAALHVFSGENGFEFYSPRELTMAGLVVPREALGGLLSDQERDHVWTHFSAARLARVDATAAAMMKGFVKGVLDLAEAAPHLLHNGAIMTTLYSGLLSNVAAVVDASSDLAPDQVGPARRWAIVAQARDAVLARPDHPMSIAELCRALGVSRRTLQYCFQDVLNVSPVAFLRAVRLNGVRRMLRVAPSVTEAAAFWGFWHFGHFARDYAAMFGELPSQTHRRFFRRGNA